MTNFYASPTGSGDGSFANPAALTVGLTLPQPGDTLWLRGGTYAVSNLNITRQGVAGNPITIASYPGERAVLSGALGFAQAWTKVTTIAGSALDASINLYKSNAAYATGTNQVELGAWVNDSFQMMAYGNQDQIPDPAASVGFANMIAVSHVWDASNPFYYGPGIWRSNESGSRYIYVRLDECTQNGYTIDGHSVDPFPFTLGTNPASYDIVPFYTGVGVVFTAAAFVTLRNITVTRCYKTLVFEDNSHDILFDGCLIKHGVWGLKVEDGVVGVYNGEVRYCEFDNGFPDYLCWNDIKASNRQAKPEFQSFAVNGVLDRWNIHHTWIHDTMDGIAMWEGSFDSKIQYNVISHLHDDAIDNQSNSGRNEISHNILRHVHAGISRAGTDPLDGTIDELWIHHNIIDNTRKYRKVRPGEEGGSYDIWDTGNIFGGHDDANNVIWGVIYNNTFIAQGSYNAGVTMGPASFAGNSHLRYYNNILHMVNAGDGRGDHLLLRDHRTSDGVIYDGNIYRKTAEVATDFCHNFGDIATNYATYAAYKAAAANFTPVPWDQLSAYLDCGFVNLRPYEDIVWGNRSFDAFYNECLACYVPTANLATVQSVGANPAGVAYPEFTPSYRGAINYTLTTLSSQPGSSGIDTYVQEASPTGSQATAVILSAQATAGSRRRILIRPDLSLILPTDTPITATLYLYLSSAASAGRVIELHRILSVNSGWVETGSWNAPFSGGFWSGDGGHDGGTDGGCGVAGTDYATKAMATYTFTGSEGVGAEIPFILDMAEFLLMLAEGNGLVGLRTDANTGDIRFNSSDATTPSLRPKMDVLVSRPFVLPSLFFRMPIPLHVGIGIKV